MKWTTLLICALLCLSGFNGNTQTVLAPGDLVIILGQSDNPNKFAFYTKVDLDAGTEIYFTDCGADASGFNSPCMEGAVKYTAPAGGISAGSIIMYESGAGTPNFSTYTDSRINFGFSLSIDGDQIIAFQDSNPGVAPDPGEEPTFLFALNLNSTAFNGNKASPNQTGLPSGLSTTGTITALGAGKSSMPPTEWDNAVYNDTYDHGSYEAAFTAFTDIDNWLQSDISTIGSPFDMAVNNIPSEIFLPIELFHFGAKAHAHYIELNWQTALEINNDYMAIERSADGRSFTEIGKVAGAGTVYEMQEYAFMDEKPLLGTNYYRLRQVDFDGANTYHRVVAVPFGKPNKEVSLYPSLASNVVTLAINEPLQKGTWLQIQNTQGQTIARRTLEAGGQQWEIPVRHFNPGQYIIQLQLADKVITERFIKY